MAMKYRRRLYSDTWHFVPTCQHWPKIMLKGYKEQDKKPTTGELCNECQAKARKA